MGNIDEKRLECVRRNKKSRKIVIYGAGRNLENTYKQLRSIFTEEIIICDIEYDDIIVKNPQILKEATEEFYVVVSIYKEYSDIRLMLKQYGYKETKDYCYYSIDTEPQFQVIDEENYCDKYGNRVVGNLNGAQIKFLGRDSIIVVGENFAGKDLKIVVHSDVRLSIGNNVHINSHVYWSFADDSICNIGNRCLWYSHGSELITWGKSECNIGEDCKFGEMNKIILCANTSLKIGNDALFSKFITIRTNDGHAIYDLHTGECLSSDLMERRVIINDHVWIGEGVMILYNTIIGSGSIVGAKSLVKGIFPNNCIIAGHMAKVIRKDIAWSHNRLSGGLQELKEEWKSFTKYSDIK